MYGSQAMSKDLNLPFPASPFRLAKDEIDLTHHPNHQHGHHHPQQQEQQHQQMGSGGGFLRYRSTTNTVMGDYCEEFLPNRASGHEEEPMYARFMAPDLRDLLGEKQGASAAPPVAPSEVASPHMLFQLHQQQSQQQQPVTLPNISGSTTVAATAAENLFRPMTSMAMEQQQEHPKGHGSSSLIRHSSSPAGLFSHLNVDNGFASMSAAADPSGSASSSSRLKGPQLGFSPRHGTASFMSQISEMGSDGMGGSPDGEDGSGGGGGGAARCYIPGYPVATWDESASLLLGDGLHPGGRRPRDPSELQNGELRGHPHLGGNLAHHLSLPAPGRAAEMASVERFLQFQDAVPCKLRAKRGCATHPRSIAERVRRTRISERMRKLQELVPNMDKQTNTADMLDLAVEYIKELERQAKVLSESRAKCTCSASSSAHRNNNHQLH